MYALTLISDLEEMVLGKKAIGSVARGWAKAHTSLLVTALIFIYVTACNHWSV